MIKNKIYPALFLKKKLKVNEKLLSLIHCYFIIIILFFSFKERKSKLRSLVIVFFSDFLGRCVELPFSLTESKQNHCFWFRKC